jgi:hypothetical protein
MAKKLKFAVVKWLDASMSSPHWTAGELPVLPSDTANVMTSCGFVAQSNKKWVVLVQTVGENVYANSIEIPRKMIMEIKTIEDTVHS